MLVAKKVLQYIVKKKNQLSWLFAYRAILHATLSSAVFFFPKNSVRNTSTECPTVCVQIRPDILSNLIRAQTVCKVSSR